MSFFCLLPVDDSARASKFISLILSLLAMVLMGCGGGSEDFSQPLPRPKAPPENESEVPVATKPDAQLPGAPKAVPPMPASTDATAGSTGTSNPVPASMATASAAASTQASKTVKPAEGPQPDSVKVTDASPNSDHPGTVTELSPEVRECLSVRHRQAVSFDGQFALTALSTSRLSVHDIRLKSLIQESFGKNSTVTALAISPRRHWIVAADDAASLRLWTATKVITGLDVIARDHLRKAEIDKPVVKSEHGIIRAIAAVSDGQALITGSDDGTLQLWKVEPAETDLVLVKAQHWSAHEGPITALAVSLDGHWLVSGGADRKVQLWDVTTGSLVQSWLDPGAAILDVAISADGKTIAASSFSKTARWWSADEPATTAASEVSSNPSSELKDKNAAAAGTTGEVKSPTPPSNAGEPKPIPAQPAPVPKAASPKVAPIPTSFDHPDIVLSIALSSDGKQMLTGCKDRNLRVWDLATGKMSGRPETAKSEIVEVRFVDDDKRLLTRDRSGVIRNRPRVASSDDEDAPQVVASANSEWLFATPAEFLTASTFNVQSPAAAGSPQLEELLEKLRTGETRDARDEVRARYFDHSSQSPGASESAAPLLWKPPANSAERSERPQLIGSIATTFPFSTQDSESRRTLRSAIQLTLTNDAEFLAAFELPTSNSRAEQRVRSPNTPPETHNIWLWDVPSQGLLRHWDDLREASADLHFVEARSHFLSPTTNHWLSLSNGQAEQLTQINPAEEVSRVAVSPDGLRLAVTYAGEKQSTNKVVRLLDSGTLKELAAFEAFEAIGTAIEFLPDGSSLLVAVRERQVHRLLMLDAATLETQSTLEEAPHTQPWLQGDDREIAADRGITSLVISADSRTAMTSGSYGSGEFRLNLWKRNAMKWTSESTVSAKASQRIVDEFRQPAPLWFVGGRANQLAAISDKGLGVIEASTGRLVRSVELKEDGRERGPYAWSADGNWLAQGTNTGGVMLWNLRTDKDPGYFAAHLGPVKALTLSRDGQTLATLGEENQLHLWNLANWVPKNRVTMKKPSSRTAPSAD